MDNFLAEYPINVRIPVAWGEMDALQHVNNSAYFRYFETARLDFLAQLGLLKDLYDAGIGPVLGETNARFKRPVTFPDNLTIGVTLSDLSSDRFTMHFTVFSEAQQTVTTVGWGKIVMFNFKTGQKSPLTEAQLAVLTPYLKDAG